MEEPLSARSAAYSTFAECQTFDFEVPERELVRELLFVCQGIDSRHIRFEEAAGGYLLERGLALPPAARQLLQRVAETGWLYRRLSHSLAAPAEGSVARAFAAAVRAELAEYFRLVALLEQQAQLAPPSCGAEEPAGGGAGQYLTLRRLDVWLEEPRARLRLLTLLSDAARGLQGGALARALHAHAATADPEAGRLVGRLLGAACAPLLEALSAWVTRGELGGASAPEFFVLENEACAPEEMWRGRFVLRGPEAMPPFLSLDQAGEVLRIGKCLHFLRTACADAEWAADAPAALRAAEAAGGLRFGNAPALEALLRCAGAAADARLRSALFGRFQLGAHCAAIKRYLLLGQGDFIASLLDAVGPQLSARASSVSAFQLMGVLEAAIRSSNAQFDDPDALGRLRVRLMPHGGGESGWDVFSLEYVVTPPLTTLLTEAALAKYLRIFNFLWRLKRVEHALNGTWGAMKPSSAAGGGGLAGRRPAPGELAAAPAPGLAAQLRRCHRMRAEMAHFVTNLQYYIMFEVLEHSWETFTAEIGAAADLDGLIGAHERYLEAIVSKALLGERSQLLAQQLAALFELMLRFRALAERLFEQARGEGEDPDAQLAPAEAAAQLDALSGDYQTLLEGWLNLLPVQRHVDLRSLLFRLDFSGHYS